MEIKVLGPGCKNCTTLAARVEEALRETGIMAEVEKLTDMVAILEYEIMLTPALVLNGKVKVSGRVPTTREIVDWLKEEQGSTG